LQHEREYPVQRRDRAGRRHRSRHHRGELTAATATVDGERDLLMRLVLKQLGKPITGVSIDRDLKVVLEMGKTPGTWSEMLKVRPPSAFPIP
jgi:hypothetical protein